MKKLTKDVKEYLEDFFEYNILNKIRYFRNSLVYGTKSLIKWFPVIWRDRHWDHIFFHEILRHKLFLMKEFYNSDNVMSEKTDEVAETLSLIIDKLDLILEDDFANDCYDKINEKYGELEMKFNDDNSLNIYREKSKTPEQKEHEREEFLKCLKQEEQERNDCLDYVYKMIRDDVNNWWD